MSTNSTSSCLVARAVPCTIGNGPIVSDLLDLVKSEKDNAADALADSLRKLSVQGSKSVKKSSGSDLSPADFVQLQTLRSSALARKTNTTSKFGRDGATLFEDLLFKEKEEKPLSQLKAEIQARLDKKEEKKAEEAQKAKKENEQDKDDGEGSKDDNELTKTDDSLLPRGPVRANRVNMNFHPYVGSKPFEQPSPSFYQTNNNFDCSLQHQWHSNRELLSNSSTPDTINSDLGYSSSTSPQQRPHNYSDRFFMNADINSFLSANKGDSELPDVLADFILKYSRQYTDNGNNSRFRDESFSDENCSIEMSPKVGRPASVDSNLCDSPLSAGSAPQSSPAAPHGGMTGPSTPMSDYRGNNRMGQLRSQLPSGQYTAYLGQRNVSQGLEQHPRPAKDVLRSKIQEMLEADALEDAWTWTCKCQQYYPGALCYQDADRDTLLHIVTQHMDLAKIYALVEQMLKTDYAGHQKPFDMKNREGITPLFLAVEKRNEEVVDYLLEAGANPNSQNSRPERDAPLHYAAARGMFDIVKTICSYGTTNLNMMSGMGLTPLLCAVKNHGVFEEDSKSLVNNTEIIQILLKYGADPMIPDSTNGRTVIHYAVDRMAPEILDVFKNNLEESVLTMLVNQPDNNRETALSNVQALVNTDENVRSKLCLSLIMCGASNNTDDY